MPTIIAQITDVKRIKNNTVITVRQNNNVIERMIDVSEFNSWQQFAEWLITQTPDYVLEPDKCKTLEITFHVEHGENGDYRVVDNVVVS